VEFSRQSNIPSMYAGNDATTIQTQPVFGELEPLDAMSRLLGGQHLTFQVLENPRSIVVRRDPAPIQEPPASPGNDSTQPLATQTPTLETVTVHAHGASLDGMQEVLITGSLIHTAVDVLSPLISLSQKDLAQAPYNTVQDSLYQVPLVSLDAPREDLPGNGNYQFGAGINLRALGVGATLVLVNGKRQPLSGFRGDFVDVSAIPWAAVERMEVLPDGASAVYGSDAIGGVINIILKNDFRGAETQLRFGSAPGGPDETTVSQLLGTDWGTGKAMLAYQYSDATPLAAASRGYASNADKRPFGGRDYRSIYANPGNLFDPSLPEQIFGISPGQDGASPSIATLTPGSFNLENPFAQYDLFPHRLSHSLYVTTSQAVSDLFEFFTETRFTWREIHARRFPTQETLLVPPTNPFFVAPTTSLSRAAVTYSFLQDLGPNTLTTTDIQYVGTLGTQLRLPRDWHATLAVSYGSDHLSSLEYNLPDPYALDAALADSNPTTAFNPYVDSAHTNPATLQAIRLDRSLRAASEIAATSLVADGPLCELPAGVVKLALGIERRQETSGQDIPILLQSQDQFVFQRYDRTTTAAFAELQLPLSGGPRSGGPPRLELTLAARYDRYSDFGSAATPMERITWSPLRSMRLRVSWGKSFRVPPLAELYDLSQNQVSFAYLPDPHAAMGNSLVLVQSGVGGDLKAETATTWTAGLDLKPEAFPGFEASVTGFAVDYRNRITQPALDDPDNILFRASEWAPFIIRNPSSTEVATLCESPLFGGSRAACLASSPAAIIDYRLTNLTLTRETGVTLDVSQSLASRWGELRFSVNASDLLEFDQTATVLSPARSVLNTVGNPISIHSQAAAEWYLHSAAQPGPAVRAALHYTGAYRNPGSVLVPHVRSATTVDLQLFGLTRSDDHWWDNLRLSLNVQNVFNQSPPFVDSPFGYDISNAQPRGRTVSLLASKDW
jgi:iron complex outermembrane recepter protein